MKRGREPEEEKVHIERGGQGQRAEKLGVGAEGVQQGAA